MEFSEELLIEIGQHMVSGFDGPVLTEEFKDAVRRAKIGNVIFFTRNIESVEQLNRLCKETDEFIFAETGYHPFITIDQEGGTISRLPESAPVLPGQMGMAALQNTDIIENCTEMNGEMLTRIGCNFNLAPSVDVNENPMNPVIGIRSFGDDYDTVADYSAAAVRGYDRSGVLCCAKHFPGHGDTATDSHLALPMIDKSLEELEGQLRPFKAAIDAGVPAVMSSHILFPQVEKEKIPCTMSRTMLTDLLRKKMGFNGLILTDCMEMQAIGVYYGTTEGTLKALSAGADIVFICHHADLCEKTIYKVCEKYLDGGYDKNEFKASFDRIKEYKKRLKPVELITEDDPFKEEEKYFDSIAKETTVTIKEALPESLDRLTFIAPKEFISSNISDQTDRNDFASWLSGRFPGSDKIIMSADPGEDEIRSITSSISKDRTIVIGTNNGHLQKGQLQMIRALHAEGFHIHHFVLSDPYDASGDILSMVDSCTLTFEYSVRMFERVRDILNGEVRSVGKLPVIM